MQKVTSKHLKIYFFREGKRYFLDHTEILLKNSFNISITVFYFSYLLPPPKRDIAL